MSIQILYFASLREAIGKSSETLETSARSVGQLRAELQARGAPYAQALQAGKAVRAAINQEVVADDALIAAGDEVAFFPPVTGG